MPYVNAGVRGMLNTSLEVVLKQLRHLPYGMQEGAVNYVVIRAAATLIEPDARGNHPRYADYSKAIGALECAKLELYRRQVAPYEETCMAKNGDVFPGATS